MACYCVSRSLQPVATAICRAVVVSNDFLFDQSMIRHWQLRPDVSLVGASAARYVSHDLVKSTVASCVTVDFVVAYSDQLLHLSS